MGRRHSLYWMLPSISDVGRASPMLAEHLRCWPSISDSVRESPMLAEHPDSLGWWGLEARARILVQVKYIVGFEFVEMANSTNPKPTITCTCDFCHADCYTNKQCRCIRSELIHHSLSVPGFCISCVPIRFSTVMLR